MNCCVSPAAIDAFAGVTAIDTSVGAVTVSVAEPVMEPDVAWIVLLPAVTPAARPELAMVATAVDDEVQVAEVVRFCVLPLL